MKKPFETLLLAFLVVVVPALAHATADPESAKAEAFDPTRDNISGKYLGGPVLLYDCEEKHWVCVSGDDAQNCDKTRATEGEKKQIALSCARGTVFETKSTCLYQLRTLTMRGNVPRACLHPDHRSRFIGFR